MVPKALQRVAIGVTLVTLSVLGLVVGRTVGSMRSPREVVAEFETGLRVGAPLPRVTLEDASGDTLPTDLLLTEGGRVFLFIDPQCASCGPASRRWQQLVEEGELDEVSVIGVTSRSADEFERYRRERGITFPILRDVHDEFKRRYDVVGLPYEVVVGASGIIRVATAETVGPIDLDALRENLAR